MYSVQVTSPLIRGTVTLTGDAKEMAQIKQLYAVVPSPTNPPGFPGHVPSMELK